MKIAFAAALATGLIGLTGCKINKDDLSDLEEGESFELGELRWNVLYDRFLNIKQVEDADYAGSLGPPPAGTDYFGVFVLIDNKTEDPQPLPEMSSFKITDSTGAEYAPIASEGKFEFPYGGTIEPHAEVPDPDSTAANGPVQGLLLLFDLNQDVTESRPLQFHIRGSGDEAVVKLDL
jgi:hypothetical protein